MRKKFLQIILVSIMLVAMSSCGNKECVEHDYSSWTVKKEASCTENGERTRTCSICKREELEVIKATGHSMLEPIITSKATCSVEGVQEIKCSVCGYIEKQTIAKTAHSFGKEIIEKDATCADTGIKTNTCKVCGQKTTTVIQKTNNHECLDWVTVQDSTCTSKGSEECVCLICGKTQTREIALKDHKFGPWTVIKDSSCSSKGSEESVCLICNKTESREITMKDHSFGPWNVKIAATVDSTGLEERGCSICNAIETREISKLPPEKNLTRSDVEIKLKVPTNGANNWYVELEISNYSDDEITIPSMPSINGYLCYGEEYVLPGKRMVKLSYYNFEYKLNKKIVRNMYFDNNSTGYIVLRWNGKQYYAEYGVNGISTFYRGNVNGPQ